MSDPDIEELQALVNDLEASLDAVRTYGLEHEIPAIERNATRMHGTLETIKQNVPGTLESDQP